MNLPKVPNSRNLDPDDDTQVLSLLSLFIVILPSLSPFVNGAISLLRRFCQQMKKHLTVPLLLHLPALIQVQYLMAVFLQTLDVWAHLLSHIIIILDAPMLIAKDTLLMTITPACLLRL
jgi:hypothetical protein